MFYEPESSRGWIVHSVCEQSWPLASVQQEMAADPLVAGHSDIGIQNLLYVHTLSMRPRRVLEIGTHIGSCAVVIASALKRNGYGKLLTLEPRPLFATKAANYIRRAEVADYAEIVVGFSYDASVRERLHQEAPIDLVFIDGSHEYKDAHFDIQFSWDLLRQNGIIILHDVGRMSPDFDKSKNGGVRRALHDFVERNSDAKAIYYEHPLWLNPCGVAILCKQQLEPAID